MTKFTFTEANDAATLDAVSADGTYPVTLITPGLGSSAFYSESVIATDAPRAFPKGTHVYLNHAKDGPSPDKLLGTLVEDTAIRSTDGAATNRFKPLKHWADFVDQVHQHTGLSINARGDGHKEVMDGREVTVADTIDYHRSNSVDLVSFAGREGSGFSESLFQEALAAVEDVQTDSSAPGKREEDNKMEMQEQITALAAKVDSLVTLMESATIAPKATEDESAADRAAAVAATRLVESAEVPASVKTRLIEGINGGNYAVEDEIQSVVALREELKTELKESGYVVGAAGHAGSGADDPKINGWGTK